MNVKERKRGFAKIVTYFMVLKLIMGYALLVLSIVYFTQESDDSKKRRITIKN